MLGTVKVCFEYRQQRRRGGGQRRRGGRGSLHTLVTICIKHKIGTVEFEMTIPNMFSDDRYWYYLLFRRNRHFKMTRFFNVRVCG